MQCDLSTTIPVSQSSIPKRNCLDRMFSKVSTRVTRKHWPLVHAPPLRTGSVDYLRTGPWTTPTDPSTDHSQNKIKNKNKDFAYCLTRVQLIDHSCQRNFARLYAGLRWVNVTDLGSDSGASYFIADHYIFAIFVAVALHERPGSLRDLWFLSLRYFVYVWNSA